jgi:uncharacterized protein (DUF2147 family)
MIKGLRLAAGLGLAAAMSVAPVMADTSLGIYQYKDGTVDFEVFLCGADEKELCMKALDARGKGLNDRTRPMLGKWIVQNAKPAGENRWKGKLHYLGHTLNGTLQLWPGDKLYMSGCAYLFFCDDLELYAAKSE